MSEGKGYVPGSAFGADVEKQGTTWTLVLVRQLSHPPEKVWAALTNPEHLRKWAPFDSDRDLATVGATAKLTTVGAPKPHVTETKVTRADAPKSLEYSWGGFDMRWELEPTPAGTRLKLWTGIARAYISMGAAGWHICFDVLDRLLAGRPVGRIVGPAAMEIDGFHRLHAEYAKQFGVEMPDWAKGRRP